MSGVRLPPRPPRSAPLFGYATLSLPTGNQRTCAKAKTVPDRGRSQAVPCGRLATDGRGSAGPDHRQAPAAAPDRPGTQHEGRRQGRRHRAGEAHRRGRRPTRAAVVGRDGGAAHGALGGASPTRLGGTVAGTARRHAGSHPQPHHSEARQRRPRPPAPCRRRQPLRQLADRRHGGVHRAADARHPPRGADAGGPLGPDRVQPGRSHRTHRSHARPAVRRRRTSCCRRSSPPPATP
jgi:hypothetical protein